MIGCGRGPAAKSQDQKSKQLQEAIYDEPLQTAIDLTHNQSYGHMNVKKENLINGVALERVHCN